VVPERTFSGSFGGRESRGVEGSSRGIGTGVRTGGGSGSGRRRYLCHRLLPENAVKAALQWRGANLGKSAFMGEGDRKRAQLQVGPRGFTKWSSSKRGGRGKPVPFLSGGGYQPEKKRRQRQEVFRSAGAKDRCSGGSNEKKRERELVIVEKGRVTVRRPSRGRISDRKRQEVAIG